MADFFDTSEDDLKVESDKLIFEQNEVVRMLCTDYNQNMEKGSLVLRCNILSGPHHGKTTSIYINAGTNDFNKKVRAQFLRAFWTDDQIKNKQCDRRVLINRLFDVKSRVSDPSKNEKGITYQNWEDFQDRGQANAADAHDQHQAPAQSAAPAQPAGTPGAGLSF